MRGKRRAATLNSETQKLPSLRDVALLLLRSASTERRANEDPGARKMSVHGLTLPTEVTFNVSGGDVLHLAGLNVEGLHGVLDGDGGDVRRSHAILLIGVGPNLSLGKALLGDDLLGGLAGDGLEDP